MSDKLQQIVEMAGLGNAKWPCYLVRFERGGACIRYGRGSGVSTAPLYAMGIHDDGTVHFLALDSGARQGHNINYEPCGMDIKDRQVTAWAGGEDLPVKRLHFDGARWGEILWIVDIGTRESKIIWPETGSPPGPGPGPEPPSPKRDKSTWSRYRYYIIGLALIGLFLWLGPCT